MNQPNKHFSAGVRGRGREKSHPKWSSLQSRAAAIKGPGKLSIARQSRRNRKYILKFSPEHITMSYFESSHFLNSILCIWGFCSHLLSLPWLRCHSSLLGFLESVLPCPTFRMSEHSDSSQLFFFGVCVCVCVCLTSNPIPSLPWLTDLPLWNRDCWFWVGTSSGHLREEQAYAVKESMSLPARNIQTGFQRPVVQSLHLCSMVSCETSLISYVKLVM